MLKLQNISFRYRPDQPIIKDVSFEIQSGKQVALIGASGCGKSTLLKLIYGLLNTESGTIFWNEKKVLGPLYNLIPGEEKMKLLSQGFELQAFRTVSENIGQFLSNFDLEKKDDRIQELLEIVELEPYAETKVENLSGGQKQRVALAKVLAKKPELLLLDEPFGNIDNFRRNSLRRNLYRYLKHHKITSITATHDKTDILSFAEETLVIKNGQLIRQDKTLDLYRNPKNHYIASLFGEVNLVKASAIFPTDNDEEILIYPHEIIIDSSSPYKARVKKSYFAGNHYLVEAVFNQSILFFHHQEELSAPTQIGVSVSEKLLENRT